jgi:hypothetical protein
MNIINLSKLKEKAYLANCELPAVMNEYSNARDADSTHAHSNKWCESVYLVLSPQGRKQ